MCWGIMRISLLNQIYAHPLSETSLGTFQSRWGHSLHCSHCYHYPAFPFPLHLPPQLTPAPNLSPHLPMLCLLVRVVNQPWNSLSALSSFCPCLSPLTPQNHFLRNQFTSPKSSDFPGSTRNGTWLPFEQPYREGLPAPRPLHMLPLFTLWTLWDHANIPLSITTTLCSDPWASFVFFFNELNEEGERAGDWRGPLTAFPHISDKVSAPSPACKSSCSREHRHASSFPKNLLPSPCGRRQMLP